jgi:serine protease Do
MNDVNLRLFQFDYDVTWFSFFLGSDERVYGRYGGRDSKSCDARLSVAGFKHTMKLVLDEHKRSQKEDPPVAPVAFQREVFQISPRSCVHCHQVWEGQRRESRANGTFDEQSLYVYPIPENVGLTLSVDEGNRVAAVKSGTAAAKAGLRAGDILEMVHRTKIFSQGDVMAALHDAPVIGSIKVKYRRDDRRETAELELAKDWKKSDLSWRPSMVNQKAAK